MLDTPTPDTTPYFKPMSQEDGTWVIVRPGEQYDSRIGPDRDFREEVVVTDLSHEI